MKTTAVNPDGNYANLKRQNELFQSLSKVCVKVTSHFDLLPAFSASYFCGLALSPELYL